MRWSRVSLWSATTDFSGCPSRVWRLCFLILVAMDRPVCPMYTRPHSQGTLYTTGVLSPRSSFTGRRKLEVTYGRLSRMLAKHNIAAAEDLGYFTIHSFIHNSRPCYWWIPYNFLPLFSPCHKGSTWPYWDRFSQRSSQFSCLPPPPNHPSDLILFSSNLFIYIFNLYCWFIWDLFI
jgi:hypothetical protein